VFECGNDSTIASGNWLVGVVTKDCYHRVCATERECDTHTPASAHNITKLMPQLLQVDIPLLFSSQLNESSD